MQGFTSLWNTRELRIQITTLMEVFYAISPFIVLMVCLIHEWIFERAKLDPFAMRLGSRVYAWHCLKFWSRLCVRLVFVHETWRQFPPKSASHQGLTTSLPEIWTVQQLQRPHSGLYAGKCSLTLTSIPGSTSQLCCLMCHSSLQYTSFALKINLIYILGI